MDANDKLIEMIDDDQGEGVKDPIPDDVAQQLQRLASKEELLENLEEQQDPLPWMPEVGTKFILKFEEGEREYKVTYINRGKYRFSSEPTDKSYLK